MEVDRLRGSHTLKLEMAVEELNSILYIFTMFVLLYTRHYHKGGLG